MDYKGYRINEGSNFITVEGVEDFDPIHTFECGQCFRWVREPDGSHTGVAGGRVANIKYQGGILSIDNASTEDFCGFWHDYLDLGRDYSAIKNKLFADEILKTAIPFGAGIRLLKQDLWETLISFIISANNRIPMIMKVVSALSEAYGDSLEYRGRLYYTFPDASRLACTDIDRLSLCKGGFRCRYILETSGLVADSRFDLAALDALDSDNARKMLTELPGVGDKVADCTLLYSGLKHDVFPTDVWIKRIVEELYFGRKATFKEIREFARSSFGDLAGFAQQYLFFYARENKIGQ